MQTNEIKYEILSSSSNGNCIIFNKFLAIDMGVSYKQVKPYLKELKIILLTHVHSDHFCKATIKKIAYNKPTMKWVCGEWLVDNLVKLNVPKQNIYVVKSNKTYEFGAFTLIPLETYHDVRNMSYRVNFKPTTLYYATDTSKLDYLECLKGLDYYFIEANYSEEELENRIKIKEELGEFAYEDRVKYTHLSKEKANSFLIEMMGNNSKFVYCHQHIIKEKEMEERKNDN